MPLPELLAPAGSFESVTAAVQNGADAVYFGFGRFHARQNARGFTQQEFEDAVTYCRRRGVKVYATLNTLATDRELEELEQDVLLYNRVGVDAVLVQDLGVLHLIKMAAPELPVHASTQMSVHNLDGVRRAHDMGISRVVLARELSRECIAYICRSSPIEIEVFVHGSMCVSHSGQCYLSAVVGERSGNRGLCAGACRLPYGFTGRADTYPLSLKDLSLTGHLQELAALGVAAFKIEGRMKRPEYVALVTKIYADAIREGREPSPDELKMLEAAFSRQGFSDGYYMGEKGAGMFGVREEEASPTKLFAQARASYTSNREIQRVPVRFYCLVQKFERAKLAVEDDRGNICTVEGELAAEAYARPLIEAEVKTQLYKTGGTPYRCDGARVLLDPGLSLPLSSINAMRREVLEALTVERSKPPVRESGQFKAGLHYLDSKDPPKFTLALSRANQLSPELIFLEPELISMPLQELVAIPEKVEATVRHGVTVAAALPRVVDDSQGARVRSMLDKAYELGVRQAYVGNLGHIELARSRGFELRGDFGLNLFNSQALKQAKKMGLLSATLSFELSFPQIRDLSKCLDVEAIVYGRMPLMVLENCVIKNRTGQHACDNLNQLTDRTGAIFPVVREFECRNVLYNSKKIFLADKMEDFQRIGLWGARLLFTTENPRECVQVARRYMNLDKYELFEYTRGLYYRGVE